MPGEIGPNSGSDPTPSAERTTANVESLYPSIARAVENASLRASMVGSSAEILALADFLRQQADLLGKVAATAAQSLLGEDHQEGVE